MTSSAEYSCVPHRRSMLVLREHHVTLARNLTALDGVTTTRLNEQVKRNAK
jgi:hypothetical protein